MYLRTTRRVGGRFPGPARRRLSGVGAARPVSARALLVALSLVGLQLAACERRSAVADDVDVRLTLTPRTPVAGVPGVVEITLHDGRGRLVAGADLRVEAHMAHPGMAPVAATATERTDGVHELPLQFTMAGDWVLHISGTLADGRRLDRWMDVRDVRPAQDATGK